MQIIKSKSFWKKKIPILIGILFLLSINGLSNNKNNLNINLHAIKKNESYKTLTDSTIYYDFGIACYIAGTAPKGRVAINELIKNKNYLTIKSVLDGFNDEGKMYAIEALLNLAIKNKVVLTEINKKKIKSIIEENKLIQRCQGCMVSHINSLRLFSEPKYKDLLKANNITIDFNKRE